MINWSILSNALATNPGDAFTAGMEKGATRSALSALATNPNDPRAMNALAAFNPEAAMQMQEHSLQRQRQEATLQQQQQAHLLEKNRERITLGGRLIEQLQPKDQAGWQQVLAGAQQMGVDVSDIPQTFDPAYAQGVVQQMHALNPQKEGQAPALQRTYEYLRKEHGEAAARDYLIRSTEPPPITINGPSGTRVIPRSSLATSGAAAAVPATSAAPAVGSVEDGYRFRGGDPGDPANWEKAEGGATPAGSRTFPGQW